MATRRSTKFTCPKTGITVPECSCAHCLTEQIRRFRPQLLAADPIGEIHVTVASEARRRGPRTRSKR